MGFAVVALTAQAPNPLQKNTRLELAAAAARRWKTNFR
jgi:hypothetical protein